MDWAGRPALHFSAEEIRWAQQRRSGGHSRGDQVGTAEEIRWAQQRRSGGHSKGDQVGKAEETGGHSRGDQVGTAKEIRWAKQRRSGGHSSRMTQPCAMPSTREMTSYQLWSEALHIRHAQAGILSLRL